MKRRLVVRRSYLVSREESDEIRFTSDKIRPYSNMVFGFVNRAILPREGPVLVGPQILDVHGRIVADAYVNDANVAEVLKEEGYARR